jgi:hypothetical protein
MRMPNHARLSKLDRTYLEDELYSDRALTELDYRDEVLWHIDLLEERKHMSE